MAHPLRRLISWWHDAPGAPRLVTGDQSSWWRVLPVAVLGALLVAIPVGQRAGLPGALDPTAPFEVGAGFATGEALAAGGLPVTISHRPYGYDGQWFLAQATDPLVVGDIVTTFDAPRYRALRVMMPALGWLLAAGRPGAIPYSLLLLQVLAVGLGCAALARVVTAYRRSRWWGLAFAAIPGIWIGASYGTAEPLAVALAALGVSLTLDRRYGWAGLAYAVGALTKETYVAFAVAAALFLAIDSYRAGRPWARPAAAVLLPAAAGLAAWWWYVQLTVPPDLAHGLLERFEPPLVGWLGVFWSMMAGDYPGDYPVGWASESLLVASFVILVVAVAGALWLRQTLLAYLALGWGLFGLIIAGFLLERFLSAQRALAPAIFATAAFLIATLPAAGGSWWRRHGESRVGCSVRRPALRLSCRRRHLPCICMDGTVSRRVESGNTPGDRVLGQSPQITLRC